MPNRIPYRQNLDRLLSYLDTLADHDIVLAPEVSMTDYDYERLDDAVAFGDEVIEELCHHVDKQIVGLTLLQKGTDGSYHNDAIVIHDHKIVHRQSKHKLFVLGDEDKYLRAGTIEQFELFEIDGVRYGMMICFELRFKEIWKRLEGADVILIPSQWGAPRKRHLEILGSALAVMNQTYVMIANSSKPDMASSSAIYSPSGGVILDDMREVITADLDMSLLTKMRRYIVMK